jgi:hypothetical protein
MMLTSSRSSRRPSLDDGAGSSLLTIAEESCNDDGTISSVMFGGNMGAGKLPLPLLSSDIRAMSGLSAELMEIIAVLGVQLYRLFGLAPVQDCWNPFDIQRNENDYNENDDDENDYNENDDERKQRVLLSLRQICG